MEYRYTNEEMNTTTYLNIEHENEECVGVFQHSFEDDVLTVFCPVCLAEKTVLSTDPEVEPHVD